MVQTFFWFTYLVFKKTYSTRETYGKVTLHHVGTLSCHPNINPRKETISYNKDCKKEIKRAFKFLTHLETDRTVNS